MCAEHPNPSRDGEWSFYSERVRSQHPLVSFAGSRGQLSRQMDREDLRPRNEAVNGDSDLTISKKLEPRRDMLGLGEASGLCVLCQGQLLQPLPWT